MKEYYYSTIPKEIRVYQRRGEKFIEISSYEIETTANKLAKIDDVSTIILNDVQQHSKVLLTLYHKEIAHHPFMIELIIRDRGLLIIKPTHIQFIIHPKPNYPRPPNITIQIKDYTTQHIIDAFEAIEAYFKK